MVFVFLYKVFYSALYIYNNLNKYAYSYRLHVIGTTAHLFHVKIKFLFIFTSFYYTLAYLSNFTSSFDKHVYSLVVL